MGTTLKEDNKKYEAVMAKFKIATTRPAAGRLIYAGNLWPVGVVNPNDPKATPAAKQMRREIDYAFEEARALVTAGYVHASAACRGDEAAALLMTKWFGKRQTAPGAKDWWRGAYRIIGRLQTMLSQDINVFYRGDDSLLGKPTDYPGESGALTAKDLSGYAETDPDAADGNIGLCKEFFARRSGGVFKTARKGRDSVGGCLLHELSHNYCGTEDHDAVSGGDCYGESMCLELAKKRRRRAWYNADNIEYFCEDALYGMVTANSSISMGTANSVANLRAAHQQVIAALNNSRRSGHAPAQRAPSPNGAVALLRAQLQAAAVAQNPALPVAPPVSSGKIAQLRSIFEQ